VALTVHPTDGFINRLLQQSSRTTAQPLAEKGSVLGGRDHVSISKEARDQSSRSAPDMRLESKLLQMYNQKSGS